MQILIWSFFSKIPFFDYFGMILQTAGVRPDRKISELFVLGLFPRNYSQLFLYNHSEIFMTYLQTTLVEIKITFASLVGFIVCVPSIELSFFLILFH